MKKVLLIIADITTFGGVERVFVNLANALAGNYEVTILSFCRKNSEINYDLNSNVKVEFWDKQSANCIEYYKKQNPIHRFYLRHIHSRILSYQIKNRFRDFEVIINTSLYCPYFKNLNTQYIQFYHGPFKRYSNKHKYFDTFIILATQELEKWKKYHSNVKVIPNFIPKMPQEITDYTQKIVVSIGRMSPDNQKGFLRLVEIWNLVMQDSALKDWKLHIVGDGDLKPQIKSKIKELNLSDSINLKPFTKEVEKEYLSASIYAMSSHFEGLPMVLLEASSYGLACMSFDIKTGPRDIIEHQKSGFLIADNALADYAKHLKILMQDSNLRNNMGMQSQRIAREKFSKEVVMQQWIELFDKMGHL